MTTRKENFEVFQQRMFRIVAVAVAGTVVAIAAVVVCRQAGE